MECPKAQVLQAMPLLEAPPQQRPEGGSAPARAAEAAVGDYSGGGDRSCGDCHVAAVAEPRRLAPAKAAVWDLFVNQVNREGCTHDYV